MKRLPAFLFAISSATLLIGHAEAAKQSSVLSAQAPIEVSKSAARFDLMAVDTSRHRLLAAHSQAGTLTIVDLTHSKLEREVSVGRSSGIAIDQPDDTYFVGTERGVAVVNRDTLKKTDFIATHGPADAMVFDAHNNRLYVGHDDGKELWIIDPRRDKVVGHIAIPGAPELMTADPRSHRLFVNIKPRDETVAIDPSLDKVVAHWSTKPTESPHGLALDPAGRHLFVAGHSRIVSIFSVPAGKPVGRIDIGPGHVDQIALDASAGRLYCPSSGRLVVVKVSGDGGTALGSIAIPKGTHSVAVDPSTHRVWIAYADRGHSYVQAFSPLASGD